MLRCRKCGVRNEHPANFCSGCGTPLSKAADTDRAGRTQRNRIAVLGFLAAMAAVLSLWRLSPDPDDSERLDPPSTREVESVLQEPSVEQAQLPAFAPDGPSAAVTGDVTISHNTGLRLARVSTVVVSGRWVALPVHACYGGDVWKFRPRGNNPLSVSSGSWRDGEPVALWLLEEGVSMPGPELRPWRTDLPVSWQSIVSGESRPGMVLHAEVDMTRFARIHRNVPPEPGIYLQEDYVVGWTFGSLLEGGFLWMGPPAEQLAEDIKVDHFYNFTFANSREEKFIHALALPEDAPYLEGLRAFSEGFRLRPQLPPDRTPAALRREEIAFLMRGLADDLDEKGFSREVSDLLALEVLFEAGDAELMIRSLIATARYYGTAVALDRAEDILNAPAVRGDPSANPIREFARDLFVGRITGLMDQGDTPGARRAHDRAEKLFPGDPEIRLLAVEMALSEKDWRAAEGLLRMREVPPELSERAVRYSRLIERLRAEEGKVVIRFQPGQRNIPVNATVNNSLSQLFLIDTGASVVTIPSGSAEKLGIKMDHNTPEHLVSTAGGVVKAKEVTLGVIELEGRRVKDITAFVLDIPGRPEIGLLGLNYLNHFFVEIDNERGVLMLTPR